MFVLLKICLYARLDPDFEKLVPQNEKLERRSASLAPQCPAPAFGRQLSGIAELPGIEGRLSSTAAALAGVNGSFAIDCPVGCPEDSV
jgi:hypothetical protein